MRRRILTYVAFVAAANGLMMNANATGPGFYTGLMMGPATNDGSTVQAQVQGSPTTTPATPKSNQFGSRFFMGYQMNKYAAFEGGLDYFTGIKYDTKNVPTCSSAQARARAFDAVIKGIYPFGSWFDAYVKGGMALVYQTTSGALNPSGTTECGKSTYVTKFRPTLSVGASYNLTQSWVTDLSWNRTMAGSPVNNIDFFAIGISYHFVDRYCGQFLCDD